MSIIYSLTNTFETNNVANKSLMELGGYAVPGVIMANNKVEARERAEKAGLAFGFSFLTPFICLPLLNRSFLKLYKVADKFTNNETAIMHLSKKYLAKDANYMIEGINLLKTNLASKKHNVKGLENILKKFNGREDELRNKLIKVHDKVLFSDFVSTGAMLGSIYWISNAITKKRTGRDGFSAEYNMADENHVEGKAKKYKEQYNSNLKKTAGVLLGAAFLTSLIFRKGMLSKQNNLMKKYASFLDYEKGMFMSRTILLLITLFGDIPSTLFASRDKEELKYNCIKNGVVYGTFFGGDLVLNNAAGRILDKTCKNVNLVNKENLPTKPSLLKQITAPLYSLKEINEKKAWAPEVLKKTKKYKTAMFWSNFAIVTAFMGFGTPYVLNKMVKKKVTEEVSQKNVYSKIADWQRYMKKNY